MIKINCKTKSDKKIHRLQVGIFRLKANQKWSKLLNLIRKGRSRFYSKKSNKLTTDSPTLSR